MKKLLTIAMMTAAVSALAVESSNTFGILRVDSTAAQTIVSVPWEAAGGGAIKVKDVVKTANLTKAGTYVEGKYEGDQLYYYQSGVANGTYKLWRLSESGEWEGATIVSSNVPKHSAGGDDILERGGAIILVRKNATQPFYLYGQYATGTVTLNVAKGTAEAPAYSLVAPSTTTDTSLDSLASANVGKSDIVMVRNSSGVMQTLVCRNTDSGYKWGTERKVGGLGGQTEFTHVAITIPAGEGFWYISRGGSLNASAN